MSAPLSLDIRRRFQHLYERDLSARATGRQIMMPAATATLFGLKLERGEDLAPAETRRRRGKDRPVAMVHSHSILVATAQNLRKLAKIFPAPRRVRKA